MFFIQIVDILTKNFIYLMMSHRPDHTSNPVRKRTDDPTIPEISRGILIEPKVSLFWFSIVSIRNSIPFKYSFSFYSLSLRIFNSISSFSISDFKSLWAKLDSSDSSA